MNIIKQFEEAINRNHKIVIFDGAGMSTASGIPDFRSSDGVFSELYNRTLTPEIIVSKSFFDKHPVEYFEFHFDKLVHTSALPNDGHKFVHELEQMGKDVTVVTQNIDQLHQKAGTSRVFELHGNVVDYYCVDCRTPDHLDTLERDDEGIPRCKVCQGIVRPDIVLYEEPLDQAQIAGAVQAIQSADMLLVLGTSLVVYPAAGFIQYYSGDDLFVINKTPLNQLPHQAKFIQADINSVFEEVELQKNE